MNKGEEGKECGAHQESPVIHFLFVLTAVWAARGERQGKGKTGMNE